MKYFIITATDGVLSAQEFAQQLSARWPGTSVTRVTNPTSHYALEFCVPMVSSQLDGSLNRRGSCIAFVADLRDCAEFARWCRSIVPSQVPVTFCDEGMHGDVKLEPTMTAEDILRAFRESGG